MILQKTCFDFLRFAMGNAEHLSFLPTDKDWRGFYTFCKRQALLGVGFAAVEKLYSVRAVEYGISSSDGGLCPKDLQMKWMAAVLKIERLNKKLNIQCKDLTDLLEQNKLHCCILKGQGNLLNYPEYLKLRRNSGDIDVWCTAPEKGLPIAVQTGKDSVEYVNYHGRKAVIEYVQMWNRSVAGKEKRALYHHIETPDFRGTEVEVHYRPSFCHSPLRNIRMQKWFTEQVDICMKNKNQFGYATPTPSVNVVYQMCHLFSHLFETGLGLRQLMDYYFLLMQWHKQVWSVECGVWSEDKQDIQSQGMWAEGLGVPVMSKEEIMHVLRSFGMAKFVAAVMWVLHEVFAMPTHYYICEPNEKEGRRLLTEIMQGGNFGQYDERGKDMKNGGTIPHAIWKLKHVMRLVSSYPEEALWEPVFRVYHLLWRVFHN